MRPVYRLLLALLLFFAVLGCQSQSEKKEAYYEKASAYFNEKSYNKAAIELKNALQLDPEYIEAYELMAQTMYKLGKIPDAIRIYNRILQLDPDHIKANIEIASFLLLSQKTEQAMEKVNFVLEKEPDNIAALRAKAKIFLIKKYPQKAKELYEKILTLEPSNIPALQNMAKIYAMDKKYGQAEELLLKTVELKPKSLKVRRFIIDYYISRNDLENVELHLNQAIKENPGDPEPHILLGNLYYNLKRISDAEKNYLNAIKANDKALKPYVVTAEFYNKTGEKTKAFETYEKALAIHPENLGLKNSIARLHYQHKEIEEAEKIVSDILKTRKGYFPANLLKSEILLSKKQYLPALKLLNQLEKDEPKNDSIQYFKCLGYIGTGNYDQAKSSITKAIELNPRSVNSRVLLSDIYFRERSFDLAEKQAGEALKIQPGNIRARLIRSQTYLAMRKIDLSAADIGVIIKTMPDNPIGYYRMGILKSALKEYDSALTYFEKAYSKNTKRLDVFIQLVRSYLIKGSHEKAHTLCKDQIRLYNDNKKLQGIVYNLQATVFLAQNNPDKAKAALDTAITLFPEYTKTYETLARIYLFEKNKEKAVEQYMIMIEKAPKNLSPYMILGMIYEGEKNYEKAAELYEKVLEINPEFAPAANNLAYHFLKRTDNIDKGFELARIAKERLPDEPSVMDTLGFAYFKKELYGNALDEFLDSLKKNPDNPVTHYHVGQTYLKKGNKKLAIQSIEKALELKPDFEEADNARKLLEELKKTE